MNPMIQRNPMSTASTTKSYVKQLVGNPDMEAAEFRLRLYTLMFCPINRYNIIKY